jgi:CBS domain-containing protein
VARSMLVRDYMATRLTLLTPEMEVQRAVSLLLKNQVSGAPVVDDRGVLIGMLTERDCMKVVLQATYYHEYGGTVAEYMVRDVETMAPQDSIADAARRFHEARYLRYPVLDGTRLVGLISRSDVMRALGDSWKQ